MDVDDGARAPVRVLLKDLGLIQDLARELDLSIPGGDLAYQTFKAAAEGGRADLDLAAIVLPQEERAGQEIQRKD